ncbi:MAG: imidazoleglycerol-phosphate dehydratase [Conexivisphaerales archaeon]
MTKFEYSRATKETDISLRIYDKGSFVTTVQTTVPIFDHIVKTMFFYSPFEIMLTAKGDLVHHIIEDVGITVGEAMNKVLGDRAGINRFGSSIVPMDDSLVLVAIDLVRRPYYVGNFPNDTIDGISTKLFEHFFRSMTFSGQFNLHINIFYGTDPHHYIEASSKAIGMSLGMALEREAGVVRSTKGSL